MLFRVLKILEFEHHYFRTVITEFQLLKKVKIITLKKKIVAEKDVYETLVAKELKEVAM